MADNALGDYDVTTTQAKQRSRGSDEWPIVAVGTAVITLATAVLITGLGNLAIARAMAGVVEPARPFPRSSGWSSSSDGDCHPRHAELAYLGRWPTHVCDDYACRGHRLSQAASMGMCGRRR